MAVEHKSGIKLWHRVVALLLGYAAAGITYEVLQILLAYPTGYLRAATRIELFSLETLRVVAALVAVGIWIVVYRSCVRGWGKEKQE
jgi:hypothetical protein